MAANDIQDNNATLQHIFGVICENGHTSYYDKRIVCNSADDVTRSADAAILRTVMRDGQQYDVVLLRCEHCPARTEYDLDCGAYK